MRCHEENLRQNSGDRGAGWLGQNDFLEADLEGKVSDIVSMGKVALVMEGDRLQGVITKSDLIEHLAATR